MARISTYGLDIAITDDDRLLGSSYVSGSGVNKIYSTANYKLSDLVLYLDGKITIAAIDENTIGADELNISGNGSAGNILISDGDGSFSWADLIYRGSGDGHIYIDQNTDDRDIILRSDDGSNGLTEYLRLNGSNAQTEFRRPILVTGTHTVTASTFIGALTGNVTGTVLTATQGTIDHDSLSGFVGNEHIDWTADQGGTNIHAGNYTDTNTNQLTTFTLRGTTNTTSTTVNHGDTITIAAGTGITTTSTSDGVITIVNTVTNTNTQLSTEEVQDIAGPLVATGGTKTGISVTYDDDNNNMDFVVASQTDENFTTADHDKLDAIEASATADQTDAEIRTAVEAATDSNVFTDADHTKLNEIEALADVTDATNVTTAGALMDSEVTNLADVKSFDTSDYLASSVTTISVAQASAITANTDKVTDVNHNVTTDLTITGTTGARTIVSSDGTDAIIPIATTSLSGVMSKVIFDEHILNNAKATDVNHNVSTNLTATTAAAQITINSSDGDNVIIGEATGTIAGLMSTTHHDKLDGIAATAEVNVQADWTQATTSNDAYIQNKPTIPSGNQILDWTTDQGSNNVHVNNLTPVALTTVQTAANQSAMLALTTQEGDVVVRTDENKSYMHNGGTAGDMNDFTLLQTPTDVVTSVNGAVGVVTLTHDGFSDFVANEHIDWTADQGSTNIHSGNYTDTHRAIHDTPVDAATTTSISSNWAFDNVKTAVPVSAVFTDTDTDTVYTHPSGDGNLHVIATSTTNNGKVLTAGSTAGSLTWTAKTVNTDTVYTHTTNANLTGHITSVGNATVLGSFTVAQLSTALSDASISGNNSGDQTLPTDFVSAANGGTFAGDITVTGKQILGSGGTANLYLGNEIAPSSTNKGARFHSDNNDFFFDFQGDATQTWTLRDYDGSGGIHDRFIFNFINGNFTATGNLIAQGVGTFSGQVTVANGATTGTYGFRHEGAGKYMRIGMPNASYAYFETDANGGFYLDGNTTFAGDVTINLDADSVLKFANGGTNASVIYAGSGDDLYVGGGDSANVRFFNGLATQFYGTVDIDSTLNVDGNSTLVGNVVVGTRQGLKPSNWGYSSSYKTLIVGSAGTTYGTDATTLCFNVDLSGNSSGSFTGAGAEYMFRNVGAFKSPNAANSGYNTIMEWDSTANTTFAGNVTISKSNTAQLQLIDTTNNVILLQGCDDTNAFIRSYVGPILLQTNGGTTALTLDTSQNATFAGAGAFSGNVDINGTGYLYLGGWVRINNPGSGVLKLGQYNGSSWSDTLSITSAGAATFAGNVVIDGSNAVNGIDLLRPSDNAVMQAISAPDSSTLKIGGGNQSYVKIFAHTTEVLNMNNSGDATFAGNVEIGDYFKMGSAASYMGVLGFNRNTTSGAMYNSSYGGYQLQNYQGTLQLQVYTSGGGLVGTHTFSTAGNVTFAGTVTAAGIVNVGGIGSSAAGALANIDINDTNVNGTSTTYLPNITFKAAGVLKAQIGKLSGSTNAFTAAKNIDGPVNIISSDTHSGHTHNPEYIFGYEPSNSQYTWGLNLVDGSTTPNSLYISAEGLNSTSSIFFGGYTNALLVTRISLNQTLGTWLYDCPDAGTSNVSVKWRKYNTGGYMANMIDFEDDGDIKNINGSYGTISSDERVKENIVDATSKLDDILSLKVKNFNFIGDNKKQIGLIAQEVEEIFPSWVNTRDTRIYKTHDEEGIPLEEQGELVSGHEDGKSLKVGMEFAVLTKAIQELEARVKELENK